MERLAFRVGGKSMTDMIASHIMERNVVSFRRGAYCHEVADLLFNKGFGSVPIVDHEQTLIGLMSEYDILNALMEEKNLRETLVQELMAQPAISVKEETPIEDVIGLLQSRHLIRVPVVDKAGKLSGLVTRRDILNCYIKSQFGPLPGFRHNV
ncbi:MAG: CBS domain-containing protein [Nitrospiria bacterium]